MADIKISHNKIEFILDKHQATWRLDECVAADIDQGSNATITYGRGLAKATRALPVVLKAIQGEHILVSYDLDTKEFVFALHPVCASKVTISFPKGRSNGHWRTPQAQSSNTVGSTLRIRLPTTYSIQRNPSPAQAGTSASQIAMDERVYKALLKEMEARLLAQHQATLASIAFYKGNQWTGDYPAKDLPTEFSLGEILAWKAFAVRFEGINPRLSSLRGNDQRLIASAPSTFYQPGEALEAHKVTKSGYHQSGGAPDGIHAMKDFADMATYLKNWDLHSSTLGLKILPDHSMEISPKPDVTYGSAIAKVALWGEVIEHTHGYRAQFCRVVEVVEAHGALPLARLKKIYNVKAI